LYGARTYLAEHGPIKTPAALGSHPFVSYIEELLDYPEMSALQSVVPGAAPVFRSSSSAAQHSAVAAGVGLGMLHRLAADQDARLTRIFPGTVEAVRTYWLVMHADQQRTPRIRAIADFLGDVVNDMRERL
jgi:DNA-binding transcriptional LysR family regulator